MAQFSHFLLQEKSWLCKGVLLCCVFCRKKTFFHLTFNILPIFHLWTAFHHSCAVVCCHLLYKQLLDHILHWRISKIIQVWKMRTNNTNVPISCLIPASSFLGPTEGEMISSMRMAKVNKKCLLRVYLFLTCMLETNTSYWQLHQLWDENKRCSTQILKPINPWEPYGNREFDWQCKQRRSLSPTWQISNN